MFGDGNSPLLPRCKFNGELFNRTNGVLKASLAGAPIVRPLMLWYQEYGTDIPLPDGTMMTVAQYVDYQYNYWNVSDCNWPFIHFTLTLYTNQTTNITYNAIMVEDVRTMATPVISSCAFPEYITGWHSYTPPILEHLGVTYAETTQTNMAKYVSCTTFVDASSKYPIGVQTYEVLSPNQLRFYLTKAYIAPMSPPISIRIKSTATATWPASIQTAFNLLMSAQLPLLNDPAATALGIENPVRMYLIPPTPLVRNVYGAYGARSVVDDIPQSAFQAGYDASIGKHTFFNAY